MLFVFVLHRWLLGSAARLARAGRSVPFRLLLTSELPVGGAMSSVADIKSTLVETGYTYGTTEYSDAFRILKSGEQLPPRTTNTNVKEQIAQPQVRCLYEVFRC